MPSNERSAEFYRGAVEALNRAQRDFTATVPELQADYIALLAAAEAREAGESDSIKLAKLIDGMFYCEGGGYDSDDVREGIQKAFEIGVQSAGKTETREAGKPTAAEVIAELHGCFDTIKHLSADIGTESGDIAVNGVALLGLAKIARWKEGQHAK